MFRLFKKIIQTGRAAQTYRPGISKAPEGFSGAPEIDEAKCTGCGVCVTQCPTSALQIKDDEGRNKRTLSLSYADCIFCQLCAACPDEAIHFNGAFELAVRTKEELSHTLSFELSAAKKQAFFVPGSKLSFGDDRNLRSNDIQELGAAVRSQIKSLFGRSLHIREVDAGSCNGCELEIVNLNNPVYDLEQYGIHFVASPRHADMLLVTGPVTRQMELALVKTYQAMPSPKWVAACGACAIGGGSFRDSYAVINGVDQAIPVDVYIPGCPPRPEAILYGIFLALGKVKVLK